MIAWGKQYDIDKRVHVRLKVYKRTSFYDRHTTQKLSSTHADPNWRMGTKSYIQLAGYFTQLNSL